MELKVSVDGVQRVVCGVTEKTTCQEVVIALAQALGRTGRYTLKEKFKEYERSVSPGELLLESLAKYGQQSREVQLALHHSSPALVLEDLRSHVPLRKVDRGGCQSSDVLHRQSQPPLSCLRLQGDTPQVVEDKRLNCKSLTMVEEARGWLQSLGRSGRQQHVQEKGKGFSIEKTEEAISFKDHTPFPGVLQEVGNCKQTMFAKHQQRVSFLYEQSGSRRAWGCVEGQNDNGQQANTKEEAPCVKPGGEELRAVLQQQARLLELQAHIYSMDVQIHELEEKVGSHQNPPMWQHLVEEEEEEEEQQLEYWENELRAEEGYEKDLQKQFLEMKQRAAECKARLEEYKLQLQGLGEDKCCPRGDLSPPVVCIPTSSKGVMAASGTEDILYQATHCPSSRPEELRETWARTTALHCAEVMLHLSSTRV
ncbi:ras association domain-containing protein 8-like isoform X1 [Arapaima gigas]